MKVLSVASECVPLVKTGGLADVAGALPGALAAEGIEMRTVLPGYPEVMAATENAKVVLTDWNLFGGPAKLLECEAAGLSLLVVNAPHLYDRPGSIYLGPDGKDMPDNPERFAALCYMAARIAKEGVSGWRPDVVHGHDWQAGLFPEYLDEKGRPGTVMTIHNIAFHGLAPASKLVALRLNPSHFTRDGFEYWGKISALKAGLMKADRLTTVSQTYAQELMTPEFGMGLEGVMRLRREALTGIVNGIDGDVWGPENDAEIIRYRDLAGKEKNKAALRKELGLPDARGPLCVVISRQTHQKGLDLLLEAMHVLLEHGGQLAILGTGDPVLQTTFKAQARNPNVSVHIGYDEGRSHRMIAGGDAILVPSRFEPCGLTQLYGLRYGTIPLVALTGGLADTVINASPAALATGVATGIQFNPITADSLRNALARLCALYADKPTWERMQKNAMKQPVGWEMSAKAYAGLYRELLTGA